MRDSYQYRKLIECGGLKLPTFKADVDAFHRIRDEHHGFVERSSKSTQRAIAADFYRMNASFHELLARCSGNRFIEQAIRQQNQLRRFEEYARFTNNPPDIVGSCRDHIAITDAVLAGDLDWASALLFRHLSVSEQR